MRFHALDGLRGLCALTVALLHLYNHMRLGPPDFIEHSFALVDFFFVLSGFVIAHAFFDTLAAEGQGGAFMLRRIGRLYPLHVFMLTLFLAVEAGRWFAWRHGAELAAPPFSEQTSPAAFLTNLLLLQSMGLHDRITWNFPAWSISVEFYANLLFAIVMVSGRNGLPLATVLRRKTVGAALLALVGGAMTIWVASRDMVMTFDEGFVRCIYGFFCGVLAQRLRATGLDPLKNLTGPALAALEIGATLAMVAFIDLAPPFWLFAASPPAFAAVTLIYARERGPFARLLLTPPFHAIGEWSYSIYMIHMFLLLNVLGRVVSLAGKHGWFGLIATPGAESGQYMAEIFQRGPWAAGALTLVYVVAVLAASSLTFRFVEKPARRWFNDRAARRVATQTGAMARAA